MSPPYSDVIFALRGSEMKKSPSFWIHLLAENLNICYHHQPAIYTTPIFAYKVLTEGFTVAFEGQIHDVPLDVVKAMIYLHYLFILLFDQEIALKFLDARIPEFEFDPRVILNQFQEEIHPDFTKFRNLNEYQHQIMTCPLPLLLIHGLEEAVDYEIYLKQCRITPYLPILLEVDLGGYYPILFLPKGYSNHVISYLLVNGIQVY